MAKKEFKSESKRLLDLMINSIYTNKDIFLRELLQVSRMPWCWLRGGQIAYFRCKGAESVPKLRRGVNAGVDSSGRVRR